MPTSSEFGSHYTPRNIIVNDQNVSEYLWSIQKKQMKNISEAYIRN